MIAAGFTFGGAFLSGCERAPDELAIPPLDQPEEIINLGKADFSLPKLAALNHTRLQFILLSEKQSLTNTDFSSRTNQTLPFVRLRRELSGKQDFRFSLQKFSGCWIVRADGMGARSPSPTIETCRKHSRVVEDYEVVGMQKIGKISEC
jgi:hypothetical protein